VSGESGEAAGDRAAPACPVTGGQIAAADPRAEDVRGLLAAHLAFAAGHTPPEHIHALDTGGLLDPAVTFYGYRCGGQLLAIGALRQLGDSHAEIKSMHTARAARGRGIGRVMLTHLLGAARARGIRRVSLETGTMAAFAPARALYASAGFRPCEPFADYQRTPDNTFMTLWLDGSPA
jgi:putative acetyltransferase